MREKNNKETNPTGLSTSTGGGSQDPARIPALAGVTFAIVLAIGIGGIFALDAAGVSDLWIGVWFGIMLLIALTLLFGIKIASQWEKVIVLRLGKFIGLRGPGFFWVTPLIETTPIWIDHRVMVTPFNAEKTLTKDTIQLIYNRA